MVTNWSNYVEGYTVRLSSCLGSLFLVTLSAIAGYPPPIISFVDTQVLVNFHDLFLLSFLSKLFGSQSRGSLEILLCFFPVSILIISHSKIFFHVDIFISKLFLKKKILQKYQLLKDQYREFPGWPTSLFDCSKQTGVKRRNKQNTKLGHSTSKFGVNFFPFDFVSICPKLI